MNSDIPQEPIPQNPFEELTLSQMLTILLNAGYSFEQLKRMTMRRILSVVSEKTSDASSASQAQAA